MYGKLRGVDMFGAGNGQDIHPPHNHSGRARVVIRPDYSLPYCTAGTRQALGVHPTVLTPKFAPTVGS